VSIHESALDKLRRLGREAKQRAQGTAAAPLAIEVVKENLEVLANPMPAPINEFNGIALTSEQQMGVSYALQGTSFCMTGAAGTGKTTTTRNIVAALIQSNKIPTLAITHRYLRSGVPGIVGCAFTNKAVQNIKRVMPADLQGNFLTIHKLLEFEPVYYEAWDDKNHKYVTKMEFRPGRNSVNPLPESVRVLIIEEATMVSIELWNQLFDALPVGGNIQIILIGDIQQLPPVFGKSIFIHAMQVGIKVVELTQVHRQALDSPILELAHRILSGKVIPSVELPDWNKESSAGKLTIIPWKVSLSQEAATRKLGLDFLPKLITSGGYDPFEDVILCPWHKPGTFGCHELNAHIATFLATSDKWNPDGNLVHEVIGGMNTKYFRIGDKVLWNKTEHVVTDIKVNPKYYEKDPQMPSQTLDYWGTEKDEHAVDAMAALLDGDDISDAHSHKIDLLLKTFSDLSDGDSEKATSRQCSHIIKVSSDEFGECSIETSGDLAMLDLAYAITVHKSQGSEYRRVLFITHKDHASMLFRELIYTGVTRAKEELIIIGPPNLFVAGITSQRLPGKTLVEKIESFKRYLEISRVSSTELPKGLGLLTREAA
jgi:exodeoxyribonuclease V alpha subunit